MLRQQCRDITESILQFFKTGKLLKHINTTIFTLIPKCEQPEKVSQFRHIACCNVLYKIISKMLCNRLKKVLPDLVSEVQGAFFSGRFIMQNILVCQYILKQYRCKNKPPRCTIKVHLRKAYDSVSWGVLRGNVKGSSISL